MSEDILETWQAAKHRAEIETAELKGVYPPDVVRRLFEAMTNHYFWESRKSVNLDGTTKE